MYLFDIQDLSQAWEGFAHEADGAPPMDCRDLGLPSGVEGP